MIWLYRYTPDIWPAFASAIFLAVIGLYSWRRRSVAGAQPFAVACLFGVLWLTGVGLEAAAVGISAKIAWYKFQTIWQMPQATAMACFALEYGCPGRWLTRRNLILLSIPALLSLLLVISNDLHHFVWQEFVVDGSVRPLLAAPGWILLGYGWSLMLVNIAVFIGLFIRSPRHRWPVALMVFGQLMGRGLYLLDLDRVSQNAPLDPVVLALLVPYVMYAVALFGFHIFDPLSAARRAAIEQMQEGMVVFDAMGQALSLNPVAESIFGIPTARARGKTWREFLPGFPDPGKDLDTGAYPMDVSLRLGAEVRVYAAILSPLKDPHGRALGCLLLLHDVTERRQVQAQIMAQQWAQATLQERKQLAYELHDGVTQNLAFLNLQAQAAELQLQAGQAETAQASLARLAEVCCELQSYMRELIGNFLTVSLSAEGFCSTLRQIVAQFEAQNGLPVQLNIVGNAEAICHPSILSPVTGVQLVRIVQEALSNVHKHAGGPSEISVRIQTDDGRIQVMVSDNGAGFDPARLKSGDRRFGLQVMRQRAARIGGEITVDSTPGHGTRVRVCVPLTGPGIPPPI